MDIGKKIRRLRLEKNLTQEELADRTELSKSFISQVEREQTSPSIATLVDILQALGTNLRDFFNDETDSQIVFRNADFFEKVDDELKNRTEWIIPILITRTRVRNSDMYCPVSSQSISGSSPAGPEKERRFTSVPLRLTTLKTEGKIKQH